jgi:hypothetical protein
VVREAEKGIAVSVAVRDNEGTLLGDFQDEVRPNGEERVEIVAGKPGAYTLTIRPPPAPSRRETT